MSGEQRTNGARFARIELDVPLPGPFDYRVPEGMEPVLGARVVVPWGRTRRVGLVAGLTHRSELPAERLRDIEALLDQESLLPAVWWTLVRFAAAYYHRPVGEIALPALPKPLRAVPARRARGSALDRWRERWDRMACGPGDAFVDAPTAHVPSIPPTAPVPLPAQQAAIDALSATTGFATMLLHGVTGSGKTEVYLRWFERLLDAPRAQALLLVPEIALTPQFVRLVQQRFPSERVAVLHSGLADAERATHWLAAAEGRARLVVGTRLSVLAPLPGLAGIVVDEEHDPSYKQHEGAQYSARDLAIVLARQRDVPVVLGSATPSLETWHAAMRGRYRMLSLPERTSGAAPPRVRLVALPRQGGPGAASARMQHGLMPPVVQAIGECVARGEQALVFLNRRGYAPVLSCGNCGWVSGCDHCSAFRVLHRGAAGAAGAAGEGAARYRLVCHHCGADGPVPRNCPTCGNVDLSALGRGTQRIEEGLRALFPQARIARIDRDAARRRGATQAMLDDAHAGRTDILVGTQMLAKGHDFARLTRVVVVDADSGLFSADFRAPERMFATLTQVAGRAGRAGLDSEVLVQTRYPDHPLFDALAAHDFARFADLQLDERRDAHLPPFVHQALLRADAKQVDEALMFLSAARLAAVELQAALPEDGATVTVYDPVPMPMVRVAGRERAQLLLESASRKRLHRLLDQWLEGLRAQRTPVRWSLEVDPAEI